MAHLRFAVAVFALVGFSVIYSRAVAGHNPHAVCDDKASKGASAQEVDQCRTSVDFAMSAGW